MTSYDYRGEPIFDMENGYRLLVIDPTESRLKCLEPEQLDDWFNEKTIVASFKNLMFHHRKDWKYPSDIHPTERLSNLGGRETFHTLDGDYVERLWIASERIMSYLRRHLRLSGDYDAELIATFIVCTYFMDIFEYAPRFLIRGGTGSGKTELLKIFRELCYRGNIAGDTTEAVLFRNIDRYSITPLLDEYQDYDYTSQNSIKKILKNGITKGIGVQRTEKYENGQGEPRSYDVFAPLVYVNQAGGKTIPQEVINRSISITMIYSNDVTIPIRPDYKELEEIRNELYTIKWLWLLQPKIVGFDKIYESALKELQSPDGVVINGERVYFSSRCRDILSTLYTASKMCGTEKAIIDYFNRMQQEIADDERNSDLGKVFEALMSVLQEQDEYPFFKGHEYELLTKITTFDIARKYEDIMSMEGELPGSARIPTRTVTNMLKDMGFSPKRSTNNKSVFKSYNLRVTFLSNLVKYGSPEQLEEFKDELTTSGSLVGNDVVNQGCQTDEKVNKLTTGGS